VELKAEGFLVERESLVFTGGAREQAHASGRKGEAIFVPLENR
jgi:hypothetical protein